MKDEFIKARDELLGKEDQSAFSYGFETGADWAYSWCELRMKPLYSRRKLQAEITELKKSGYKGSCYLCEPIGEENKKLREALEMWQVYGATDFNAGVAPKYTWDECFENAKQALEKE